MVFHWSLSDSKSPQISRTRLRILAVLSSAVVWIVSTRPPNSKSSGPFENPSVIVPNAPITIDTIVTFMFHSFFKFSSKVEVLILLFTFLQYYYYYYYNLPFLSSLKSSSTYPPSSSLSSSLSSSSIILVLVNFSY